MLLYCIDTHHANTVHLLTEGTAPSSKDSVRIKKEFAQLLIVFIEAERSVQADWASSVTNLIQGSL